MINLHVLTPPNGELIPLAEVKLHLRVEIDDDDELIKALVESAREYIEDVLTWRALSPRTYLATYDTWDGRELWLPMPPTITLTELAIVDEETSTSVVIDLANVRVDKELGRVRMLSAAVNGGGASGRLTATYEAGYPADALPGWARAAVLLLVGHWYENRETVVIGAGLATAEVPMTVNALCFGYRAWRPGGAM